jgi:signal transduction histidine kinase
MAASRRGRRKPTRKKARAKKRLVTELLKPAPDQPTAKDLAEQLEAVRSIGEVLARAVGLDALFRELVPMVSKLLRAERSTLFLYDPEDDEIWSKVAQGDGVREIRLKLGSGLAGWVAEKREPLLVPDAYEDPRFNSEVDARTGFRTRSVAVTPVIDRQGHLVGVLQVLNHKGGPFSQSDIGLLSAIGAQAAYAVENAHLTEQLLIQNRELDAAQKRAERRRAELDLLYQLEQEISSSDDLDQLLDSIIVRTSERLRSAAGSVLLADKDSGRLFFRAVEGPKKDDLKRTIIEPGEGVVGWVAKHAEPLIVNHPHSDPRHGRHLADKLSYPAMALLAVPLVWDGKVIGAIEVLNPSPRTTGAIGYDDEDMKLLTLIAAQAARAVSLNIERRSRRDTERLAVIGRMLAGVAHDLRNPMTVISGYAQLMAMALDESERAMRCERILQQIDEMTGMVADLLAFARGDSRLRPIEVSVPKLAQEVQAHVGLQCSPRGIDLHVVGEGDLAYVDLSRVKRIIYNLARNAVDVLSRGDRLEIVMSGLAKELRVRVTDSGPGIPEALKIQLFTPFIATTKVNGTGLGLSIVKRFVDDHHGDISVDSEPGRGTSFIVRLPHVREAAKAEEAVS